jgi:DNA-binding MurR/RpiR family transcriptional regulator
LTNEEDAVSKRISEAFDLLSKGQRQVARFVVDNQTYVAFSSAADVAQKADVSIATVIRFCQTVGYQGYPDLQDEIQERLPRFMTTVQRVEERLTSPIPEEDVMARVFARDIDNVKQAMEQVDQELLNAVVDEMSNAAKILVIGEALSSPPALFFGHSLKVMGFPVETIITGGVPLSLELSKLKEDNLLIGISFWRYFQETFNSFCWAGNVGAKRIAITDSDLSPLTKVADYAFTIPVEGIAHSISPVASMSLINVFIAMLFFRNKEQARSALLRVDAAYKEGKLLLEE